MMAVPDSLIGSHLSKSKYLAGVQCLRRLWLACNTPELGSEPDEALLTRLEEGTEIGLRARELFPGGMLVEEPGWEHDAAVVRTRSLIEDASVPAIFEAAFECAGVRIRVDVLERLPGGAWGLREVKSGTAVKDVHLDDLAVQAFVLRTCGLRVPSVEVIHVNSGYVRRESGIDWPRFFTRVELATEVAMQMADVPTRLAAMRTALAAPTAPAVEPSHHCFAPHPCEFWAHCTQDKSEDWVLRLPRLGSSSLAALRAAGVERIRDIPDDFPLSERQARARAVWRTGERFISPDLHASLESFGPPADYLDFETINPGIPLYRGTHPYEAVPFQWSLHRVDDEGVVEHYEFLADGRSDPRPAFVESLLETRADRETPVVVYSAYERRILDALSRALPAHAAAVRHLSSRLVDLLPVVRASVYDATFGGSYSLKAVAPALAVGFAYDDLDLVADGTTASSAFLRIASGVVSDTKEEQRLRLALREYCARDTIALVHLHSALREMLTQCTSSG